MSRHMPRLRPTTESNRKSPLYSFRRGIGIPVVRPRPSRSNRFALARPLTSIARAAPYPPPFMKVVRLGARSIPVEDGVVFAVRA